MLSASLAERSQDPTVQNTDTATLWKCARCGAKLLSRNLSHACGAFSVNRVGRDYIDVHFVLPRNIEGPRIRRVEQVGKLHVHHLRLRDGREFDRELAVWLRQSYTEYGQRGWRTTKRDGDSAKKRR